MHLYSEAVIFCFADVSIFKTTKAEIIISYVKVVSICRVSYYRNETEYSELNKGARFTVPHTQES